MLQLTCPLAGSASDHLPSEAGTQEALRLRGDIVHQPASTLFHSERDGDELNMFKRKVIDFLTSSHFYVLLYQPGSPHPHAAPP